MNKIGRNAPCPCGSGKKYKKCCLPLHSQSTSQKKDDLAQPNVYLDDIDILSNSVVDLINEGRLDEAEKVCQKLLKKYPDQIDGIERLAEVYEAGKNKNKAAEYYKQAADFAKNNPGFDSEIIEYYLTKANEMAEAE